MKRNLRNALVFLAAAEALTGCGTTQPISNQPPLITQNYVGLSNPSTYPIVPPYDPSNRFQNGQGQTFQPTPSTNTPSTPNYLPPPPMSAPFVQSQNSQLNAPSVRVMNGGSQCSFTSPGQNGPNTTLIDLPRKSAEIYYDGMQVSVVEGRCLNPSPSTPELQQVIDAAMSLYRRAGDMCRQLSKVGELSVSWNGPLCSLETSPGLNGKNLFVWDISTDTTSMIFNSNINTQGQPFVLYRDGSTSLDNVHPSREFLRRANAVKQQTIQACQWAREF